MTHLDLFSGIGGFALAAEAVWPYIEHTFCDNDLFCQEVLKKHWPQSKIHGDIRTLTNTRGKKLGGLSQQPRKTGSEDWTVDLLTGGFPCQPFSQAGQRKGTGDDRHLWPEMRRVIQEFSPRYVVAENVRGLLSIDGGVVFESVCADLEAIGYEVQPFLIPACAVDAPHRRDRVWIVAYRRQQHGRTGRNEKVGTDKTIGTPCVSDVKRCDKDATNTKREGHKGDEHKTGSGSRHHRGPQLAEWTEDWPQVATRLCRMDDGIPRRMDRNPRLKALGNAIVPQVAVEIFKAIKNYDRSL